MINYTAEELRLILKEEEVSIELKEAEEEYQKLKEAEDTRHEYYRNNGIGYILDTEKVMNLSDRGKLMNPVDYTVRANPLVMIGQLKLRIGGFICFWFIARTYL